MRRITKIARHRRAGATQCMRGSLQNPAAAGCGRTIGTNSSIVRHARPGRPTRQDHPVQFRVKEPLLDGAAESHDPLSPDAHLPAYPFCARPGWSKRHLQFRPTSLRRLPRAARTREKVGQFCEELCIVCAGSFGNLPEDVVGSAKRFVECRLVSLASVRS